MQEHNEFKAQVIIEAIESIQRGTGFGAIEIVLHDGRVTQIEKREKQRFQSGKVSTDKQTTSTSLHHSDSEATNKKTYRTD